MNVIASRKHKMPQDEKLVDIVFAGLTIYEADWMNELLRDANTFNLLHIMKLLAKEPFGFERSIEYNEEKLAMYEIITRKLQERPHEK
jgi:hypothetical protein